MKGLQITTRDLDAAFFERLSELERKLFLIAGQIHFEVTALNKVRVWSLPFSEKTIEVERAALLLQSEYFARLLGACLFEGWECLRLLLHSKEAQSIPTSLSPEARNAHSWLKKWFGKKNGLGQVRNQFAYHFAPSKLLEALPEFTAEDSRLMTVILGAASGNTVVVPSMLCAWLSVSKSYDSTDFVAGLEKFQNEISDVLPNLACVCEGLIEYFLIRELGADWGANQVTVEIREVPEMQDIRLPYFIKPEGADF